MTTSVQSTHEAAADARNDNIKIFVNGDIVPKADAKVSVYDSGFMLGDGVWEGLRLYNGRFAFLEEHLDRLYGAAKALDLDIGLTQEGLTAALYDTVRANDMRHDVHVRLMVTRRAQAQTLPGPASERGRPDHRDHRRVQRPGHGYPGARIDPAHGADPARPPGDPGS